MAVYQRWSRWLTPLFQSDRDAWAKTRDVLLGPMGRLPGGRGHMLRVLSGTGFLIAYDDPVGVARELAAFCG